MTLERGLLKHSTAVCPLMMTTGSLMQPLLCLAAKAIVAW